MTFATTVYLDRIITFAKKLEMRLKNCCDGTMSITLWATKSLLMAFIYYSRLDGVCTGD